MYKKAYKIWIKNSQLFRKSVRASGDFFDSHCKSHFVSILGFPHLESPGFFFFKIPGPGKSWKITLVLESPGKLLLPDVIF